MNHTWKGHEDSTLRFLWAENHSPDKISQMLGDRTRCAVVARAHRLKLPGRPNPCQYARKAADLTDKLCANPECGKQLYIVHGHKDRKYCGQPCANKVIRERQKIENDIRPPKNKPKLMQCTYRNAKDHRCAYLALPWWHECYGESHA